MGEIPKYLRVIADLSRPDQLSGSDYPVLMSRVKECTSYVADWAEDEGFWDVVSVNNFAPQMVPATAEAVGFDKDLANWVVSSVPSPSEQKGATQKTVLHMSKLVPSFIMAETGLFDAQDTTVPLTILQHLFKAASGGLMIAVAAQPGKLSLSTQASAFACGLAAITDASKAMRKQLAGKLPPG